MDRKQTTLICCALLLTAVGVRLLSWQDNRFDALKVEWGVTAEYKEGAQALLHGDLSGYFHNLKFMTHPPGYSILLALISKALNDSNAAVQLFQIVCDALAVVVVFLIVAALLSRRVGVIAGLLVAISPQLAYYPLLVLPDSIAVLPILLAVYCVVLAYRRPRMLVLVLGGVFVGLSCWLRANALLLAPFLAALTPILFARGMRVRYSAALVLGTFLVITPITVKNLVVFHQFVPLSLGSGQKLLEGVAEYDKEGKLGVPKTDAGIIRQEAETFHRPDYLGGLFAGDGIQRDRRRVARGLSVIRAYPLWYLGVMGRRATSFLRLARVPIVSTQPTNSHAIEIGKDAKAMWANTPVNLLNIAFIAGQAKASPDEGGQSFSLVGDDSKNGDQLVSPPITVTENSDYLLRLPIDLEAGRMLAAVNTLEQRPLYETIVDVPEVITSSQPVQIVKLPFATGGASQIRLILRNAGAKPIARLGQIEMFELGPTSYRWTRYPRLLIHFLQKPFVTAVMLTLTLLGIGLLGWERDWRTLAILLIVPAYYLCVQSALHTERRYVIAIHYSLFALAAVPIGFLFEKVSQAFLRLMNSASTVR